MSGQGHLCVECLWCELQVDAKRCSRHRCARTGEDLPAAILQRAACEHFAAPHPFEHWGP